MAKNSDARVKAAVEAQSASCRTLAEAMRVHSRSLGWLHRTEAECIEGWARMLDTVAVGLGEALHVSDRGTLGRLWNATRVFAAPLLLIGGAAADGTSLWDHFHDQPAAVAAARDIVDRCDSELAVVMQWQPAPQPKTITGSARGTTTEFTSTATGTVTAGAPQTIQVPTIEGTGTVFTPTIKAENGTGEAAGVGHNVTATDGVGIADDVEPTRLAINDQGDRLVTEGGSRILTEDGSPIVNEGTWNDEPDPKQP